MLRTEVASFVRLPGFGVHIVTVQLRMHSPKDFLRHARFARGGVAQSRAVFLARNAFGVYVFALLAYSKLSFEVVAFS